MALQCSPSSQNVRLCMPLTKFSYANVPAGSTSPIPWTHISSQNDLFVLIDPFEISDQTGTLRERRYRFQVLQDPDKREDFDLFMLACEARRAIDDAQNSTVPRQQPSITIIVKNPCIAMRYPLQTGQVRRFQVRFAKEEDFYETLKIFACSKIPFVEAGVVHAQPVIAPLTTYAPSANVSNTFSLSQPGTCFSTNVTGTTSQSPTRAGMTSHSQNQNNDKLTSTASDYQTFSMHNFGPTPAQPIDRSLGNGKSSTIFPSFGFMHKAGSAPHPSSQNNSIIDSQPISSISTYIPRPSTAPVASARGLDVNFPPKRDLPFTRKTKPPLLPAPSKADQHVFVASQTDTTGAFVGANSTEEAQSAPLGQAAATVTRKRAAANPRKKPAAKKAKTSITSRKGATDVPLEHVSVSDAAEPLQHSHNNADSYLDIQTRIDTQVLLDKAESIQAARQALPRVGVHKGGALLAADSQSTRDHLDTSTPVLPDTAKQAMHLPKIHNLNDQASPTLKPTTRAANDATITIEESQQVGNGQHMNSSHVQSHIGQQPTDPEYKRQHLQTGGPNSDLISESQSQHPLTTAAAETVAIPSAPATLLSNSDFAQPAIPQSTAASKSISGQEQVFDALSTSTQHEALESWMVQNLYDESFLNLCKTIDGVWQRIFVKF